MEARRFWNVTDVTLKMFIGFYLNGIILVRNGAHKYYKLLGIIPLFAFDLRKD